MASSINDEVIAERPVFSRPSEIEVLEYIINKHFSFLLERFENLSREEILLELRQLKTSVEILRALQQPTMNV